MARKVYNFAAFQAGWFACVFGAANGLAWIGVLATALIVCVHLWIARERRTEWALLAASLPIGLGVNAFLAAFDAVVVAGAPLVGPVWLIALWPLFATTFNESMRWMMGRFLVAIAFGAVGAPLSYWAGARAGAIELGSSTWRWIALAALAWGIAMPLLLALRERLTPDPTGSRAS